MANLPVNEDLRRERSNATFDVEQMTYILGGGDENVNKRRKIESMALNTEKYGDNMKYYHMSRDERHTEATRKSAAFIQDVLKSDFIQPMDRGILMSAVFPNESTPIGLHGAMFLPTLIGQASDEQKAKWLGKAMNFEMIGTYAQTELGHGTHVRGLETQATYDPTTEEFIIHSPSLTASKWWPGGLGKASNCVILMAQLYTQGQSYGMHPFFVQIRDLNTHEPLLGVTVGDIGPKFGYSEMDNGFLLFKNFRIPRENMLTKNAEVLKDGTYVKKQKEVKKLSYGTMVFVRMNIVMGSGASKLAQACTIAVRYSAVRRQSQLNPSEGEPQVLDYQTQQHKLLPLVATAYAHWFVGMYLRNTYTTITERIKEGDMDLMPELHALTSCLKSFTTDHMRVGVEQCRLACGGHGYSHASGIPKIYYVAAPALTYEGENTVLYLQAARYLMRSYEKAQKEKVTGSVSYLSERLSSRSNLTKECHLPSLLEAYKHRAARFIGLASQRMNKLMNRGMKQHIASNMSAVSQVKASQTHGHYVVLREFMEAVYHLGANQEKIKSVLHQLCQMYALYGIMENAGDFLEDTYMTPDQIEMVHNKMDDLLAALRPNAVALVDAFDFPDRILCSALGRYDGNVYEELYKFAQNSNLNKQEVVDEYQQYVQPLREAMGSKL